MRKMILAMGLATALLGLGSGAARAADKGPKPDVGAGRITWFDITTTNLQKAKEFYGKLFDWHFTSVKGSEYATEIVAGGTSIGTIRVAEGKITPYNGVVYVQVTDLLASCKKAQELGATIPPGFPFNLPDGRGAVAVVTDPAGHPVGMYSRTSLPTNPSADK